MGLFGSKEKPEDLMRHAVGMEKNHPKAAITLFDKVLKQEPENVKALFKKGLAQNQIRKYSDAVTTFDRLLKVNPKDVQALNNKGIALAEMGNIQDASECYVQSLKSTKGP